MQQIYIEIFRKLKKIYKNEAKLQKFIQCTIIFNSENFVEIQIFITQAESTIEKILFPVLKGS